MILFGEPFVGCTIAWLFYGCAALVSSWVSPPLAVWPVVNAVLIAAGLWLGVLASDTLLGTP